MLTAPPRRLLDVIIDGAPARVPEGSTLREACKRQGIDTPTLCWAENLAPINVCRVCVVEVDEETTYVPHHKAKIAYILSAMRHHADALCTAGWRVDYVKLDDPENSGSFTGEVARAIERHDPVAIRVTEAGEWRVRAMLESWTDRFDVPVSILPDDRFLASHAEFEAWAAQRAAAQSSLAS